MSRKITKQYNEPDENNDIPNTINNFFYKSDLEIGDIINFSVKAKTVTSYYLRLITQKEVTEENETTIIIWKSNLIKINNYFEWSINNFADNLGYELINNNKIDKLLGLEIVLMQGNSESEPSSNDIIVTYTLLTFDD